MESLKYYIKKSLFSGLDTLNLWSFFVQKLAKPNILMYHRISYGDDIKGITINAFEQHLIHLKKYYQIVSVEQIVKEINSGGVKGNKVAITFDDGYEDFYSCAWPLLMKYNLPASLYVTTNFVEQKMWLWPDKVKFMLKNTSKKTVEIDGLGKLYCEQSSIEKNWNLIGDYCLRKSHNDRELLLTELSKALNISIEGRPEAQYKGLTWEQLQEMSEQGLDIGSHTLSHPILSTLDVTDLEEELVASKQLIEQKLHKPIRSICYPNGMKADVSERVFSQAKRVGYEYGIVAYKCPYSANNLFEIGRIAAAEKLSNFSFDLLCK